MHVVIVAGEGEVTQADRLAGEFFSLGTSPRFRMDSVDCGCGGCPMDQTVQNKRKRLALAGTRAPIREHFGKMDR